MRRRVRAAVLGLLVGMAAAALGAQPTPLTVVQAGPNGQLETLDDGDQIRIVFSEPMVPLGYIPDGQRPPWLTMTPVARGSFYWAGTKTLVFSPDVAAPLPNSTHFAVRVDASATSVAGRRLAAPFEFTFTTPVLELVDASWARRADRFDSPVLIRLEFNQAVRAEDVLAHARVTHAPHEWRRPLISEENRRHWQSTEPEGLARFDAKVAAVDRIAASQDPVPVRLAEGDLGRHFDERRPFGVVLETVAPVPPGAWLKVTIDSAMPVVDGTVTHPALTSKSLELPGAFFMVCYDCPRAATDNLIRALRVTDVTGPEARREITRIDAPSPYGAGLGSLTTLGFPAQPLRSRWELRVSEDLQADDGQTLGYPHIALSVRANAQAAHAFGGTVFEAGRGSHLPLIAVNVDAYRQWLEPVTPMFVMPHLRNILRPWYPEGIQLAHPPTSDGEQITVRGTTDTIERHPVSIAHLLRNGTGLFWATADRTRADGPSGLTGFLRSAVIQVTNLGITIKHAPEETLILVTRLDTGNPVAGVNVAVVDADNDTRWAGVTNGDGLARADVKWGDPRRWARPSFIVTAEKDGDTAFVGSDWAQWDPRTARVNWSGHQPGSILRGSVFSDRGVYRRNEQVHVKALLRDDTRHGMTLIPAGTSYELTVHGPNGTEVLRQRVRVNDWSSVEARWTLPPTAPLGDYRVEVARPTPGGEEYYEDRVFGHFRVAAYRVPEFRVQADLETGGVAGDTMRGAVHAEYFFGQPVTGRPAAWTLSRTATVQIPSAILERFPVERWAIGYWPDGYRFNSLGSGTRTLDPDGRLTIEQDTSVDDGAAYTYRLNATVQSPSAQTIAGTTSAVVHPASFYIALARPSYFVPGTGADFEVAAVDLHGVPVRGVAVTLELLRTEWRSDTNGSRRVYTPSGEWSATTAEASARVRVGFAESGSYVLRASARDAQGRLTRTEASFVGIGAQRRFTRVERHAVELIPERDTWKPGERARILVQSPWAPATGLLTVEREGIKRVETFTLTSTDQVVEVPITEADIPNVFVSVALIKGRTSEPRAANGADPGRPAYRVGHVELTVDDASKRLGVQLRADRREYRPGARARFDVQVTAPDGAPARGEVTLWAVDEAVLSLTGYEVPAALKAVYQAKPLEVMTVDSRERLLMSLDEEPDGRPRPYPALPIDLARLDVDVQNARQVVGFLADLLLPSTSRVRKDFRPLVVWLGSAPTDGQGRAGVTAQLPDSLTAYRVMAVAADRHSRFGGGELEIRAATPLTILPALPRFLQSGDRVTLAATVAWSGDAPRDAVISIDTSGSATIELGMPQRTQVRLLPGEPRLITFDAHARGTGNATVRFTVRAGDEMDAFELPIPVLDRRRLEITATTGTVSSAPAGEALQVPPGADTHAGGLTLELASTALVGLGEGARYLERSRYETTEPRASRALAYILAAKVDGAFRLSSVTPDQYRAAARHELLDLLALECEWGGFAAIDSRCRAPLVHSTAYVLHVLRVAREAGIQIDDQAIVQRAFEFLRNHFPTGRPLRGLDAQLGDASAAYALKVMAEARQPIDPVRMAVFERLETLPMFALSYLADTLHARGERSARYDDLVRRLVNSMRITGDHAYVEEPDELPYSWMWMNSVASTAVVLEGLARRGDVPHLAAPLARWLLDMRRNGRWGHTFENARALEALMAYHAAREREDTNMRAAVAVAGTRVARPVFNRPSTEAVTKVVSMGALADLLRNEASPRLTLSKEGSGTLHYTARVEALLPDTGGAIDRGYAVSRTYERFTAGGRGTEATRFSVGDVIRVRVRLTLRGEGQFIALTDPLPAGFEAVDEAFETTGSDLAREATRTESDDDRLWVGGFEQIEKHDDHIAAYATRLASGTHEVTYLVRAMTAGSFTAPGATVEAMYAPDWTGRSGATTIEIAAAR